MVQCQYFPVADLKLFQPLMQKETWGVLMSEIELFSFTDEQPADQVLSALSRDITTFWQDLGVELKVLQSKIEDIVMNNVEYPQPNQKGYQMLLAWKRRGESVTLDELGRALKELGRGDLAVTFCGAT